MDPKDYPTNANDKDMAWRQRKANALELALQGFPERWPIPTVTVVRGYNSKAENLRTPADMIADMLVDTANMMRQPAGLHWHRIKQLQNGVICNDTPEGLVEAIFQVFERNPDMPALLVYAVEGVNMAATLTTKDVKLKSLGAGSGPRQPGKLTDAIVALVVARPERLNWLRRYARNTRPAANPIDPVFNGWVHPPSPPFTPTLFFPEPITEYGFKQWDGLKVLAKLHRPVTVPLRPAGTTQTNQARTVALAQAWDTATADLNAPPARVFYDTGAPIGGAAVLAPAMFQAQRPVDILASNQSYDLSQRFGDTGASSPFVGIALATMATYLNADTSMVAPLRRTDQATFIAITPTQPGKQPADEPFGVKLRPQFSDTSNEPSPEALAAMAAQQRAWEARRERIADPYVDPAVRAREQRILDDFIAGGIGIDPLDPKNRG